MTRSDRRKNAVIWNKHIETWKKSGLSQAEYCRANKLSIKSFGYYFRKHRRRDEIQLVPVAFKSKDFSPTICEPSNPGLVLKIGSKASIEISRDFDSITFEKVLRAVSRI